MQIKVGADPELFVKAGEQYVSCHGLIPGTKRNPYPVQKGAVQVDGMAAEFNIDPASTKQEFVTNIRTVMAQLREMIPAGAALDIVPVAEFPKEVMDAAPDEAKELGCDPDYNAYTGMANARPDASDNIRTAAGHVHIGWTEGADIHSPMHFGMCCDLVKQLDCTLGLWSVINDPDTIRKTKYGKAGAFRPKPYGVEYRVMSNFWLKSDNLIGQVFDITTRSVNWMLDKRFLYREFRDAPMFINGNRTYWARQQLRVWGLV